MRKIGVLIGSDSDLPQCGLGLNYLAQAEKEGKVKVLRVITVSIHRNTEEVLKILNAYQVDVWIVGAGWANHLTGTVDAYLRYALHNTKSWVIGVAFEDKKHPEHTETAILSIKNVPGTSVIFDNFVGEEGFRRACWVAIEGELPFLQPKEAKPPVFRTLQEAIEEATKRTNLEKIPT